MAKQYLIVEDASVNNLKNITVKIPLNASTCVVGVSGCGKSSLVFDTIYAESQRNFLESLTANMFWQKLMDKPKVGNIHNLRPALNIAQKYYNYNPRSTIGTITDISYYIRTLYALISNYKFGTDYSESAFSPNNPQSCCEHCKGLGMEYYISQEKVIPIETKKLSEGAILCFSGKRNSIEYKKLEALCDVLGINIDSRFSDLSDIKKKEFLYYRGGKEVELSYRTPKGKYKKKLIEIKGPLAQLNEKIKDIGRPSTFKEIQKYLDTRPCSSCNGLRLKKNILDMIICEYNISDIENEKLDDILKWTRAVSNTYRDDAVFSYINELLNQIEKRVTNLIELKLSYVSLSRSIPTLSSGELQRVRIATQLSCALNGLIYVMDEPCKGLHAIDIESIVKAVKRLVNNGNTVIAIEHNMSYIQSADHVIELGPVGGPKGGYVICEDKKKYADSIAANFREKKEFSSFIVFKGIDFHNVKNQNARFPINALTCVTGVSGSGKSSLLEVIYKSVINEKATYCNEAKGILGYKYVEVVNDKPIGKTPRSTIVTYLDIYAEIRELFADTNVAKKLNLTKSDFSMNVESGTCCECNGTGVKKIELRYLPDSYIICPACNGKRFNEEVLSVRYKGLTINDVLNTSITEIKDIFNDKDRIFNTLECMDIIGLGYLKLGQLSMNLSGGEAQRIKLARALSRSEHNRGLYILDEPTSGLNYKDVLKLETILNVLRSKGNTLIIVEHNREFVIRNADYIVDFGRFAGAEGGKIVAEGYPSDVFGNPKSSWNGL